MVSSVLSEVMEVLLITNCSNTLKRTRLLMKDNTDSSGAAHAVIFSRYDTCFKNSVKILV